MRSSVCAALRHAGASCSTGANSTALILPTEAIFDGTHEVLVTSNWNAGVWRYVTP
jgi:hypothetical protein